MKVRLSVQIVVAEYTFKTLSIELGMATVVKGEGGGSRVEW